VRWISVLKYPLLVVISSLYFFPFEFSFLPGINTKMMLSFLGVIWFIINVSKARSPIIDNDFFVTTVYAAIVSLIGLTSVIINGTEDYAYAMYIVSYAVWMGGAYFVINAICLLHGRVDSRLVIDYLIGVCVCQCLVAVSIDRFPPVRLFVDSFLGGEGFMGKVEGRLYGIGASLDVAGQRFSVILISVIALLLEEEKKIKVWFYWIAFFIVAVVGNMIARTTTIGLCVALLYAFMNGGILKGVLARDTLKLMRPLLIILCVSIPLMTYWYQNDILIRKNIRFGFEGFFSIVEKGHWETNSNNRLSKMIVFPDNVKTWIIGDGYFDNPESNPNYIGDNPTTYYKGTDVGYLRFIFYFGVIGLLAFSLYFIQVGRTCMHKDPEFGMLFSIVLIINFIVWFKVSSDIFLFFALFMCIPSKEGYSELSN